MILYDPRIPASLIEFGIQIPIRESRTVKTFQALLDDPKLKSLHKHWHKDRIVEMLTRDDLLRVHSAGYVERLFSAVLEQEIISTFELIDAKGKYYRYAPETATRPLTDLFERVLMKSAGTIQAARLALQHGFCLIIDGDAHKGDGTAALTAGDDSIRTLSVHMASGWPLDCPALLADGRPNPSFIPSDIDIPIESGEEPYYLERLRAGLRNLEEGDKADLAIVVCGADPYEKDELPSATPLKLSLNQMFERDRRI
ncbi:MAG: histone deacetylase superfamily, partial [uncultured bacterium]